MASCANDTHFKYLPYQMLILRDMSSMFVTGNRESGHRFQNGSTRNDYHMQGRQQACNLLTLPQGDSDEK